MTEVSVPAEWFAHFMTHVVNNVNNREGHTRFSYKQLRHSLTALEVGSESSVDPEVVRLLQNIVGALPPLELSDRQVRLLCLAMMNAHMAYHLANPDLLQFAQEVEND